jgi:FlaG/FlaF family flagellin (archaellin)
MDDAVTPVVGVLLMLVVTIIIAAVVSGFAGGLAGSQEKAPQASLEAKQFVINEAHEPTSLKASDIYVLFENKGGEAINLNNIKVRISSMKYPTQSSMISNYVTPCSNTATTGSKSTIKIPFSRNWATYLEGFPNKTDYVIPPGGQFVMHADYAKTSSGTKTIYWWSDGTVSTGLPVYIGDYLTYDIIDTKSEKPISSGKIIVPDYGFTT